MENDFRTTLYLETGHNYRFFLNWRHAAFAANFIVVGAVLSLCIGAYKDAKPIMFLIPLIASPVSIMLWTLDCRTRTLFQAAYFVGRHLEGELTGYYKRLEGVGVLPVDQSLPKFVTHSNIISISYFASFLAMIILAVMFYVKYTAQ